MCFVLTGENGDSGVKTLNNPNELLFKSHRENVPFKKGAVDAFLLTTNHPLGKLNYLRIWTDSSGLGENRDLLILRKNIKLLNLIQFNYLL